MTHEKFTLLKEEHLSEVNGLAKLWEHKKTKAQVLSICNDDENKSFGVTFRTPPKNSTGVAHILEHSVLCGSKKYPVKEPFVELLKSSLQTFLNAMTFPDKTTYPVASTNLQDFYNLVDVYLDAVFFPRIDESVFAQEGWHIHAEDANISTWQFKGVVFNEMKGVYSSPDSVLAEETQHAVFPNNLYSLDSGGNPENILDLSYEEFKDFHSRYYHPTNARFFFWGDDAEDARLDRLAEVLENFEEIKLDSSIALQKPLDYERKIEALYAFQENEEGDDEDGEDGEDFDADFDAHENFENSNDLETSDDADDTEDTDDADDFTHDFNNRKDSKTPKNAHVTVSWLLCEGKDAEETMVLEMLEHILTGLPGSPLRKALMDSGLGEDVTGCGLETDLRQSYFSIGLRSISPTDGDRTELLIMDTLAIIVEEGIGAKTIDSALSVCEFALRENNTGSFPRGLSAMIQSLTTWLYDEDPFISLAWEKPLASIKKRLASGEKVFENAIKKWFLDNMHRVCVVLLPDESLAKAREDSESARLSRMIGDMTDLEKEQILLVSKELIEAQEREDTPEALATIPTLSLSDIPKHGKENPLEVLSIKDVTVLHHEIDTTGILYTRILLPLENVSQEEFPLLSLYCRALTEMGTQKRDFVDLGLELSAQTGGFDVSPVVNNSINNDEPLVYLKIFAKVVEEKIPALFDLLREILTQPNFSSKKRFLQMTWEDKARYEQGMIPAGHNLLASYLSGMFSKSGQMSEHMGGVPYWNYIRKFAESVDANYDEIEAKLIKLHEKIMCFTKPIISLTGDAQLLKKGACLVDFVRDLPKYTGEKVNFIYDFKREATGLIVPAQVNYVGLGGNLKETDYEFHGSAHVITRFLRMGYLWDRVRVQGGAYGCFVRYARSTGNFLFASYRDPNVERTLNIYNNAANYIGNLSLTKEELTKSIVGVMGDIDTYHLPSGKGNAALWEYMSGYTKEMREKTREEVLGTSLSDYHDFASYLQKLIDNAVPSALGGTAVSTYAAEQNWDVIKLL